MKTSEMLHPDILACFRVWEVWLYSCSFCLDDIALSLGHTVQTMPMALSVKAVDGLPFLGLENVTCTRLFRFRFHVKGHIRRRVRMSDRLHSLAPDL